MFDDIDSESNKINESIQLLKHNYTEENIDVKQH